MLSKPYPTLFQRVPAQCFLMIFQCCLYFSVTSQSYFVYISDQRFPTRFPCFSNGSHAFNCFSMLFQRVSKAVPMFFPRCFPYSCPLLSQRFFKSFLHVLNYLAYTFLLFSLRCCNAFQLMFHCFP